MCPLCYFFEKSILGVHTHNYKAINKVIANLLYIRASISLKIALGFVMHGILISL